MTYLLTGATGFIGGAVTRHLVAAGHRVRAIVRKPKPTPGLDGPGVETFAGDVTDKDSMRAPMTGVDGAFHIAGWYKIGQRDTREAVRVNVDGTRHVLELMQELAVPKGVYTSTLAVNSDTHGREVDETYRFTGRHISVYDQTKADAHRIAEEFIARGLPLVIVQPGLVYGPGDTSSVGTTLRQFLRACPPLFDAIDPRVPRSFATGFDDALDDPGRAGEHRLHRAVAAVADPACDAAVHRLVGDEGAVADALDAAPRDDMADEVAHPNSPVLCEGPLKTGGFPLVRGGSQRRSD